MRFILIEKVVSRVFRDLGIGAVSGLLIERVSEFPRMISAVPGGATITEFGVPYTVITRVSALVFDPSTGKHVGKMVVTESIDGFVKNVAIWGLVTVAVVEIIMGVYGMYRRHKGKGRIVEKSGSL